MLEKKIADKLKNHEMDPQSPDLFDAILAERGKQNSKYTSWLFGSIALMFTCIIAFSATKYWGKLPADGKTKAQVIAIKAKEESTYDSIIAAHHAIRTKEAKEIENGLTNHNLKESKAIPQESISNLALKVNKNSSKNRASQKTTTVNPILKSGKGNNRYATSNRSKRYRAESSGSADKVNYKQDSKKSLSPIIINDNSPWKRKTESSNFAFQSTKRSIKPLHTGDGLILAKEQETPQGKVNTEKHDLPNWIIPRELNLYFGAYQQNRFANGSNALSQRINESTMINQTQQFGFTAEYNIKRSIFAQVGLQWLNYSQKIQDFSYTTTKTSEQTIVDPGGQTRTISITEDIVSGVKGGSSNHNFIEVPLSIGARFDLGKRHLLQPQFGLVGSFHSNSNGLTFTNDGFNTERINGNVNRWRNIQLNVVTGVSYTYILGKRFGLYVHPNIRYSLNSQAKKGLQMDELNYMFGGQIGVKYILR